MKRELNNATTTDNHFGNTNKMISMLKGAKKVWEQKKSMFKEIVASINLQSGMYVTENFFLSKLYNNVAHLKL